MAGEKYIGMMYSLTGKKWGSGGSYGCVPKPVLAKLGNPKTLIYRMLWSGMLSII